MKYFDADALPPCELSAHCLRLLDDLDAPGDARAFEQVFSTAAKDRQDEHLIEELRAHLPNCPTCFATLAAARHTRWQQRMALRRYLVDAESRVPATTGHILAVLQQDQAIRPPAAQKRQVYMLPEIFAPIFVSKSHGNGNGYHGYLTGQQTIRYSSRWVRNGFALMTAAALLFAALGIFGHFLLRAGTGSPLTQGKSWPSVIIGVSLFSALPGVARLANVYNVDTTSGQSEQLTPIIQSTEEVQFEMVSPDGKNMLYDYSEQGQTIYSTLQPVSNRSYITSIPNDDVSNAIWMDNDHILVARVHSGVEELDIHTGAPVQYFASLVNIHLLFYHSPYLYFQDAQQTVMFRGNLLTGNQKQLTPDTGGVNFTTCVLNPDGSRLYCEAQSNQFSRYGPGLYMVNSDGSGVQSLNRRGILLGFTPDHALLFLQAASNNYQVVKLGQGPQQDQVLLKNAAPTTALIGPGDVMLAPDGHGLIVQDGNQDDTPRGVWYDDLTAQTSRELFTYAPDANGHLIGWDQLLVKGAAPMPGVNVTPTTAPITPTVPVLDPFGGWNGVVLITGTGTTYHFVSSYNYLNGDHRLLANLGANIQFDGVASSGLDMLYHVNIGQRTLFYTLHQLPSQGYFFELGQDNVLNAIWMPDSIHALIATIDEGVIEVNMQTGLSQPFLPSLRVQALKFYRDGYLYFLGGPGRSVDTLFRIAITNGVVQQVAAHSTGGDFWLSPDGLTVYFKNEGPAGQAGIYAVSSDGTRGGVIRGEGTPIGYAPDDSLVIMREVDHRFEVVQLGATPQQDRVLLSNAAPGAISLCAPSFAGGTASFSGETICDTTNIALAPYGHALIVVASYANGSSKVWSNDLTTGKQFVMLTPSPATTLMAPGWDRIEVP